MSNVIEQKTTVAEAIGDMADVFGDSMFGNHVGELFSCGEADAVARVLLAGGRIDEAQAWLVAHSQGDDEDDLHFELWDEDSDEGNSEKASEYVNGMV